jgi:GNAT superfamily N-acetyltransferase
MLIRNATMGDLPQVYDLLNALRQESIWGTIPIAPIEAYVHVQLLNILHDAKQRLVVADRDTEIVGVCGVELASHRFLPGLTYLQEWALYVLPRYRNLGIGKLLWGDVLRWGKASGAYGACYGRVTVKTGSKAVEEVMWRVFDWEPTHAEV